MRIRLPHWWLCVPSCFRPKCVFPNLDVFHRMRAQAAPWYADWIRLGEHYLESSAGHVLQIPSNDCDMPKKSTICTKKHKVGGPENPKARRHTVTQHPFFKKILWWRQLCSARNRRKIFIETSCALMVSGATIHHSMLRQLTIAADVINSIPSF